MKVDSKKINTRGFTLIELLAVIVILAIIALIATPIILGIINDVKIRKYKTEEDYMKKAANLYYVSQNIEPLDEISLSDLIDNQVIKPVKDIGGGYCDGKVIKLENDELKGCLQCSDYYTKDCGYTGPLEGGTEEIPEVIIKDTNPGIICGDGKEEDYEKIDECHIRSVEDLVKFSKMVNEGKNFAGKIVYLDNNIDIKEYTKGKSYVNADGKADYDINSDGTTSSIKEEMTSGKGFMPIGSEENPFEGRFEGQAKTISNLMINRPDIDNIGLFGVIGENGTVLGFNLENVNIIGNDNTGGISGVSLGTLKEVTVSGNVKGQDYTGGISGYNSGNLIVSTIVNANVTGDTNVNGISPGGAGIVESGTIKGNDNVKAGSSYGGLYVNENVIIDAPEGKYSLGGRNYTDSEYGNLNIYDNFSGSLVLDTYLGGDNDSSGYYFDYDSRGKVVLRSTKDYPIDTTLKGEGTKESPYEIYTAEDMKKIAAMTTEANYYKLMNDIDFKNKKYYMIGTYSYPFRGTFEGGANTLKNISLQGGWMYTGLFSSGSVIGVNFENINVQGEDSVGGIIAINGLVKEIIVSGNIVGNNGVGAVCTNCMVYSSIINANVTGSSGVVGAPNGYGVISGGTYTQKSGTPFGIGNGYINEKVQGVTANEYNTHSYKDSEYGNLNKFSSQQSAPVLDTWLGGDSDSSGYYFDYDENGKVVLRSTKDYPIDITLKGEGTKESPYEIYTVEDMKKVAAMPTEANYYKLMNDIDYTNEKYYMIGTYLYQFRGTFEGGANTLKNIVINGPHQGSGLFGSMGYSSEVYALNVQNIKVFGDQKVGGISGYASDGKISEISLTGIIEGKSETAGISYSISNSTGGLIVNANVTGQYAVTGSSGINSIVEGGTIKNGKIASMDMFTFVNQGVDENGKSPTTGTIFSSNYYNNLKYYGSLRYCSIYNDSVSCLGNAIETPYSGDINGNGYYFDYNSDETDIIVVKVGSGPTVVPSRPTESEISHEVITDDEKSVPECELNSYDVVGSGFTASYTCSDESGVVERKHLYWVTEITDYDSLVEWTPSTEGKQVKVDSLWTESSAANQGINLPEAGNCYYFYYGAKNTYGNERVYKSPYCLSY